MAEATMPVKRQAGGRNGVRIFNVEDPDGYDYMVFHDTKDGTVGCVAHGESCAHAAAVKAKVAK